MAAQAAVGSAAAAARVVAIVLSGRVISVKRLFLLRRKVKKSSHFQTQKRKVKARGGEQ